MVENQFSVGKTQWSKWHDPAREAYNRVRRQGMSHEIGVEEGNARQVRCMEELKATKTAETPAEPVEKPKKTRTTKKGV
jgi:hypothetical protein